MSRSSTTCSPRPQPTWPSNPPQKGPAMRTELIHIRTTPEIKEALRAAAEAEGRTVTNYIEWLLKKDLEQKKQTGTGSETG